MKPSSELTATLVQVAHLYYEANKSQQQIADQLGVSRSLIALYLKKARELNIVRIEIIDPQDNCEDLALSLQEKTGLKKIIVVPTATNPELTRRSLGGAVARFLETRLQDRDLIGLGWGRTIMEVVGLLAPSRPRQIEVVPLLGESGYTGSYTQMNQIVLQMANSFNGQPYFLLAPLLVGTRELQDALLKDATISEVVERIGLGFRKDRSILCTPADGRSVGSLAARWAGAESARGPAQTTHHLEDLTRSPSRVTPVGTDADIAARPS